MMKDIRFVKSHEVGILENFFFDILDILKYKERKWKIVPKYVLFRCILENKNIENMKFILNIVTLHWLSKSFAHPFSKKDS